MIKLNSNRLENEDSKISPQSGGGKSPGGKCTVAPCPGGICPIPDRRISQNEPQIKTMTIMTLLSYL